MSSSGSGNQSIASAHNERAKVAILLARLGWPVFPIMPRGKMPFSKYEMGVSKGSRGGFHLATTDEEQIKRWASDPAFLDCNWGCRPPAGVIVIDVDTLDDGSPNPHVPEDVLMELTSAGAITNTPNKGRHYWFRQPEPNRWRGRNGAKDDRSAPKSKIDIKTSNGFVVLPPSVAALKIGGGFGQYTWAPEYTLSVPPEELPVTPPAVTAWLDRILRVDQQRDSRDMDAGELEKDAPLEKPPAGGVQDYTSGNLAQFVNTSSKWQGIAIASFVRAEGIQHSYMEGDVRYFKRPGSDQPHGAAWGLEYAKHGHSGKAIVPLGHNQLAVFSPNFNFFEPSSNSGPKSHFYPAHEILEKTLSPADFQKAEELMRRDFAQAVRKRRVLEAAAKAGSGSTIEWTEQLAGMTDEEFEQWAIANDQDAADFARLQREADGVLPAGGELGADPDVIEVEVVVTDVSGTEPATTAGASDAPKPNMSLTGEFSLKRIGLQSDDIYSRFMSRVRKGGIIDLTARAVQTLEIVPQPLFRIAAGLTAVSMVVGPKIEGPSGLLANLNILLLAETGEGKEPSKRVLRALDSCTARRTCVKKDDGEEDVTEHTAIAAIPHSDSGVVALLRERSPRILLQEEFSTWLAIAKASKGSYQERILRLLTDLSTHGRGKFDIPSYAKPEDSKRGKPLPATPFAGLHLVGQPSILFRSLSEDDVQSGLLGRLILIPGDDDGVLDQPPEITNFRPSAHPELIAQMHAWRNWHADNCDAAGPNIDDEHYLQFRWGAGARDYWWQTFKERQQLCREGRLAKDLAAVVGMRYAESMVKLGLVIAIDHIPSPERLSALNRPELTVDHLKTAEILLSAGHEMLRLQTARYVARTPEQLFRNQVKDWLDAAFELPAVKEKGISRRTFNRRFQHYDKKLRDAVWSDLEAIGFYVEKVQGSGPPTFLIRRV